MAIPASAIRSNKERADGHAYDRQASIDEAKRTAAWIFKTVNELPWQQKAIFLTVAFGLVAGGVGFIQHNNIGGAKDNFKAWANAFNLTDGGDSPVVITTATPTLEPCIAGYPILPITEAGKRCVSSDGIVGVNRPQMIPPAGDMSTPTAVKSTETSTLAPTATNTSTETATQAPTATSTFRPTNTPTQKIEATQPPATATPKPIEVQVGIPFDENGIKGLRSSVPIPGKTPRFPNNYYVGDCRINPACNNLGLKFGSMQSAETYWRNQYPNAVLKYEYWLFDDGGVEQVFVELVSTGNK